MKILNCKKVKHIKTIVCKQKKWQNVSSKNTKLTPQPIYSKKKLTQTIKK